MKNRHLNEGAQLQGKPYCHEDTGFIKKNSTEDKKAISTNGVTT